MLDFTSEKDRRKSEALNGAMKAIEEKHIDFFRNREGKFESDEHDKLQYHWMIINRCGQIRFHFTKESDLPDHIRKECIEVFKDAYGGAEPQ